MDNAIKKVIDFINKQTDTSALPFGSNVSHLLFKKGEKALFLHDGRYSLLLKESLDATKSVKMLLELFSYLRDMEKEHVIYVQKGLNKKDSCLLYEGCNDLRWSQASQKYDLGDNIYLKAVEGQFQICDNDKVVLNKTVNVDFLSNEIDKYLCSLVYPTIALERYIKAICQITIITTNKHKV